MMFHIVIVLGVLPLRDLYSICVLLGYDGNTSDELTGRFYS